MPDSVHFPEASMRQEPAPGGNFKRKPPQELLWEELIEVAKEFLANPSDPELEEYFAAACLQKIKTIVRAYVYKKRLGDIFVEEGISLSEENLTKWMRGKPRLDDPNELKRWLFSIARNATITEWLKWIGRGEKRPIFVPIEERKDEKEHTHASVERKETLRKLLRMHAEEGTKRDKDSAFWITVQIEEGLPVEEIATQRCTTPDDVHHLLNHDRKELFRLYKGTSSQTKL
jgi:DNA-directed RNA polymerase specialized sigma24 family protein